MENRSVALAPGTIVKGPERDYSIIRVLGQGGFGITYLASSRLEVGNISVNVQFALKEHFISSLCSRSGSSHQVEFSAPVAGQVTESLRSFLKEARRLQNLGVAHSNIVKINEVFEANNTAYYVMEYLGGTSLQQYVDFNGPLSAAETRQLMLPLIEAVATLHKANVAHYDIKPHNIMLQEEEDGSGRFRAVLIDFGLAKSYDSTGHALSTSGVIGLTPGYASLEQYVGITTFTPGADVYALSATLYFLLTGKTPDPIGQLNLNQVSADLSAIGDSSLAATILHGLALNLIDRIPNASALLSEIGRYGIGRELPVDQIVLNHKSHSSVVQNIASRNPQITLPIQSYATIKASSNTSTYEEREQYDEGHTLIYTAKPEHLSLVCRQRNKTLFLPYDEWHPLTRNDRKRIDAQGIVLQKDSHMFVASLQCCINDDTMMYTGAWEEMGNRFGNYLPSKFQAEVIGDSMDVISDYCNSIVLLHTQPESHPIGIWTRDLCFTHNHAFSLKIGLDPNLKKLAYHISETLISERLAARLVFNIDDIIQDGFPKQIPHPNYDFRKAQIYAKPDILTYGPKPKKIILRTVPKHLDLALTKLNSRKDVFSRIDGFLSVEEWNELTDLDVLGYIRQGVVVKVDGHEFVVDIEDDDRMEKYWTWYKIMKKGSILPSKTEAKIMMGAYKELNEVFKSFGGNKFSEGEYWTCESHDDNKDFFSRFIKPFAWGYNIYDGKFSVLKKSCAMKVRRVRLLKMFTVS